MFKLKFIVSAIVLVSFLIFTSTIKNKTRVIEKNITNLNKKILLTKKNLNEAQLEFYYLASPAEVEKKLNIIGFDNYYPISYSRIFLDFSEFTNLDKRISHIKNNNEKKK